MIFFISDLHLSPRSPGATRLFLSFLAGRARQAEALYILGDLFEVWVGDDINDPYAAQITAALRAASDAGLKICFMHGNRDFAIGEQFTAAAGRHEDERIATAADVVDDLGLGAAKGGVAEDVAQDLQRAGLAHCYGRHGILLNFQK